MNSGVRLAGVDGEGGLITIRDAHSVGEMREEQGKQADF